VLTQFHKSVDHAKKSELLAGFARQSPNTIKQNVGFTMQKQAPLNPVDISIGVAVRNQRLLRRKSLFQTAKALGLSEHLYALREAGEVAFQAGDLFTLADFFGVRARDLMPAEESLTGIDPAMRYGTPEEIHDLIHHFSGIVSPSLRSFFLKQMEDASIQGRISAPETIADVHEFPAKPKQAIRRSRGAFGFLWAS